MQCSPGAHSRCRRSGSWAPSGPGRGGPLPLRWPSWWPIQSPSGRAAAHRAPQLLQHLLPVQCWMAPACWLWWTPLHSRPCRRRPLWRRGHSWQHAAGARQLGTEQVALLAPQRWSRSSPSLSSRWGSSVRTSLAAWQGTVVPAFESAPLWESCWGGSRQPVMHIWQHLCQRALGPCRHAREADG